VKINLSVNNYNLLTYLKITAMIETSLLRLFKVVTGLRGSSSRCETVAEPVTTSLSHTLPALITEAEHVGDDWLIDDARGSKRRRPDMDSLFKDVSGVHAEKKRSRRQPSSTGLQTSEPSRMRNLEPQTSAAKNDDRSFVEEIFDSESASPESTLILNEEVAVDLRDAPTRGMAFQRKKQTKLSSSGGIVPAVVRQSSAAKTKTESTAKSKVESSSGQNVTSTTATTPPTPRPNPLRMRLKIRVGDQLILVPVLERFVT